MPLEHDGNLNRIQAMPCVEGWMGLSSGTHAGAKIILCMEDGVVSLTFETGGTETLDMEAGSARTLQDGCDVVISSGKFDLA